MKTIIIIIIIIIIVIIIAMNTSISSTAILGGAIVIATAPYNHIIIDTLNVVGGGKLNDEIILNTIVTTTKSIRSKKLVKDRIMFVLKRDFDSESILDNNKIYNMYLDVARANKIYIYVICKYDDPPDILSRKDSHSSKGYDDFYCLILSRKWRCPVMTNDKLRDFREFKDALNPFQVAEINYWRDYKNIDYVMPNSYSYKHILKPQLVPIN